MLKLISRYSRRAFLTGRLVIRTASYLKLVADSAELCVVVKIRLILCTAATSSVSVLSKPPPGLRHQYH